MGRGLVYWPSRVCGIWVERSGLVAWDESLTGGLLGGLLILGYAGSEPYDAADELASSGSPSGELVALT